MDAPAKPPDKNPDGTSWRRLPVAQRTPEQQAWARYIEWKYWNDMTPEKIAAKKAKKAAADKKRHAAIVAADREGYNARHTEGQRRRRLARTPEQKIEDDRKENARQKEARKHWSPEKRERVRKIGREMSRMYRMLWKANPHLRPPSQKNTYSRRKARYDNNPGLHVKARLRTRVSDFVSGKSKSKRTLDLIGRDFIERIEEQFVDGMSWENRDKWHLDHVVPCAWFDFARADHQAACFHNSNVRPLWGIHNTTRRERVCRKDFDIVLGRCPVEHVAVFEEIIWKIRRRQYPERRLKMVYGHV